MKSRISAIILMTAALVLGSTAVFSQDPPASAQKDKPAEAKPRKESTLGDYTINTTLETGWRFFTADGNTNKYRSDFNYGRGPRVINYDFLARAKDGKGKPFDLLKINALGWGGDPQAYLRVDVEKQKVYRFDANYRKIDYFNNLANFALNQHLMDAQRKFGDFNLTFLPGNEHFKLNLGYSMNYDKGMSFTTYAYSRDEYQLTAPVRNSANDYRVGFDARAIGFNISVLMGKRFFKDDMIYYIPAFQAGNDPNNTPQLDSFLREMPSRGRVGYAQVTLNRKFGKWMDFTGSIIHSDAITRFNFFERLTGKEYTGNNITLDQSRVASESKRPSSMGNFGVTVYLTGKLSVSDVFRFNNFRINGNEVFSNSLFRTRETFFGITELPPLITDFLSIRSINYRLFQNTVEADYKFSPKLMAHAGYRYTNRRLIQGEFYQGTTLTLQREEATNETHTALAGFKATPFSFWKIYFDAEHGEADNVFVRIDNYNVTNIRVRSLLKPTRALTINTSFMARHNNNPNLQQVDTSPLNFGVDVKSRIFTSSVDWTPLGKFTMSGGYTRTHIDSDATVIFFLSGQRKVGTSDYRMRDNHVFINTLTRVHPRVDLQLGFRVSKDTGQGKRVALSPTELLSSYPLELFVPQAGLTVKLTENIDWNAYWEYYDYREKFLRNQNYTAHNGYLSLRFKF